MTTNNMLHKAGCVDKRRRASSAPSAKRAVKARNHFARNCSDSRGCVLGTLRPLNKRAAVCVARSRAPMLVRTLNLRLGEHPAQPSSPIHDTIHPTSRSSGAKRPRPGETRTRPDAAAGAARCLEVATRGRGASKRLVSVRPAAAGASLAHRGLTSTRVAPGTLASSPQVCTRTLPAKKRATQVHREPYDASSARGGWCLRSPLGAAVHPRAALYMVGGVAGGAGRRKVA